MTSVQDEIFKCVLTGDVETITKCLEGVEEESVFLGQTDEAGRNVLQTASMLGKSAVVRELARHGAQVSQQTVRGEWKRLLDTLTQGYSSLHLAACWGHVDTVRTLLELGADIQAKTFRGETPVDLARKYSKTDCADCLVLAEAKQDLMSYITFIKDIISDSAGNLTKDEKNICLRACSAKSDWIQSFKNPTVLDLIAQRRDIEDKLQPVLSRLSTHPATPAGKD